MAVTLNNDLEDLRKTWTELYSKTLPSLARGKDSAQPKWPVTLDHCFARIILDNTVGRGVLQWDNVIGKPAVRNMEEFQLKEAIELGQKIKDGKVDLVELDKQSLRARGKGKRKYDISQSDADKVQGHVKEENDTKSKSTTKKQKRENNGQRQTALSFKKEKSNAEANTDQSSTTSAETSASSDPNPNLNEFLQKINDHPKLTPFRKRLYSTLLSVPAGHYTTYASMALYLNSSARAVGNGMRNNPFAPDVPCHRVLAADGSIGGFGGDWGSEGKHANQKKELLAREGVNFDSRGKVKGPVFEGLRDMSEVMKQQEE